MALRENGNGDNGNGGSGASILSRARRIPSPIRRAPPPPVRRTFTAPLGHALTRRPTRPVERVTTRPTPSPVTRRRPTPERLMTEAIGGKPGDERGFLHKKILGLIGTVAPGPIGLAARALSGGGGKRTVPRSATARPTLYSAEEQRRGKSIKFAEAGGEDRGCVFPWRRDPRTGDCRIYVGEESGRDRPRSERDGRGPRSRGGVEPEVMTIRRSVCGRKEVLGDDGLCYHKTQISNRQRMWPRGRQPLLTGGEMRAIGIASRAGGKMERATKRLQRMGMMKKPSSRRAATHHHHPKQ